MVAFIDEHRKAHGVEPICKIPPITPSRYHAHVAKRGDPTHIRSGNGPEFTAKAVRKWIAAVGAKTAYITPGSPWENSYCESFNSKLRDEQLNGEIF